MNNSINAVVIFCLLTFLAVAAIAEPLVYTRQPVATKSYTIGGKRAMCDAIGITTGVLWCLENNNTLSKDTGHLIVNGHQAIQTKGATP